MPVAEPDVIAKLQKKEPAGFLLASVRGVGQVDFQPLLWTGVLILGSLWGAGWEYGLFATLGALSATAAAYLLGVDRSNIALGLQGFSGCLTGIALWVYLGNHGSTYVLTLVGAVMCVVINATLTAFLAPYKLNAMTAPFCIVTAVMVIGAPSYGRLWHGATPPAADPTYGGSGLTWSDLWRAFFTNVSQVFLVDEWWVGLVMLVALTLAGWRVGLFAAAGSIVGILVAWAFGAPDAQIANGIFGYNAVLVSIGMGTVFLAATAWNCVYTLIAAGAATALTASLTTLFDTFGGHTFTWPFNLTTWAFMAAVPFFPKILRTG
ncbi:urea transporter [Streptomyces nitrosporeus]|uniref:Urea transporter n=1 Tax=Streptomyces nitrosporeus TaxID=28894 RepID=A0A5J6FJB8_9ACTN|nr:urea transporter [Streptomyces nitrosporeus]QEU75020.1 urea transporter [Streptomyces nitrosporeus]GGY91608.1 urea transporter [Streptomyces nitrosporeus]